MVLCLKKQAAVHGDNYEVSNEKNEVIYTARGDAYSREAKMHLFAMDGRELVFIHEKRMSNSPTYEININGTIMGTMKKQVSWRETCIEVDGQQGDFILSNDFNTADYRITYNGSPFGTVKKDNQSHGIAYILDIFTEDNVEFFVAMLLAMDHLMHHSEV